jgi:hypothetical protein
VAITSAALWVFAAPALAAKPWALGSGASFMGGYDPGQGSRYATSEGWIPFVATERGVNRNLSWRAEATYRGSKTGRDWFAQEVHWASLGIGFRWDSRSPGLGAYLEAAPTLFGLRWIGNITSGYDSYGFPKSELRDELVVVPGLVTGMGLRLHANDRVSVSYGLRFVRSAKPLDELSPLSLLGLELGLQWRSDSE